MFVCTLCDYETNREFNFKRHCEGKRHLENSQSCFRCACGKIYTHKSSLSRHQRRCEARVKPVKNDSDSTAELIKTLIAERRQPSTTNIFNIQIFLDKECPDATSIQDFAASMNIELAVLERANKDKALLRFIQNSLSPMSFEERPFHCTDIASRQFMVKDKLNGWEKDNGMKVIETAENSINKRWPAEFNSIHPGWDGDLGLHERYLNIAMKSYSKMKEEKCSTLLSQLARSTLIVDKSNLRLCC